MKRKIELCSAGRTILVLAIIVLSLGVLHGIFTTRAVADDASDARQLVERAKLTLETFMQVRETEGFRNLVKNARGVFIAPMVLRGAFVFGLSGGSGVFLARDSKSGAGLGLPFIRLERSVLVFR